MAIMRMISDHSVTQSHWLPPVTWDHILHCDGKIGNRKPLALIASHRQSLTRYAWLVDWFEDRQIFLKVHWFSKMILPCLKSLNCLKFRMHFTFLEFHLSTSNFEFEFRASKFEPIEAILVVDWTLVNIVHWTIFEICKMKSWKRALNLEISTLSSGLFSVVFFCDYSLWLFSLTLFSGCPLCGSLCLKLASG